MQEIVPGVRHWTAHRDTIGQEVGSAWIVPAGVLVDPLLPEEGLDAFRDADEPPRAIVLTTGLHRRDAPRIADALGIEILAPVEARERIGRELEFTPYGDGDEVAPGVRAVRIGALCPDEYALRADLAGGTVLLADALIEQEQGLDVPPEGLLGDDPDEVRRGLRAGLARLLEAPFRHLLPSHGTPVVDRGADALREAMARG